MYIPETKIGLFKPTLIVIGFDSFEVKTPELLNCVLPDNGNGDKPK